MWIQVCYTFDALTVKKKIIDNYARFEKEFNKSDMVLNHFVASEKCMKDHTHLKQLCKNLQK